MNEGERLGRGDGGRTGAWVRRGGWGVTGPSQQLTGLVAPGSERDGDSGLRLVRLLLRGPCPGAQAMSSLEWSLQTGPQSWPQSQAFGCSCGPKESVHVAVLFFCFPSEDPPEATEGQRRWGEPGNRPASIPGYRQAHSRSWMGPRRHIPHSPPRGQQFQTRDRPPPALEDTSSQAPPALRKPRGLVQPPVH